ncbi:MAG TPA: ABC transporter ATP-binding protein [Thermoanaerobaculia bacterium]|nr:ABC transporter ATP-binding protein [Thermoanaerobaculia bacterium]
MDETAKIRSDGPDGAGETKIRLVGLSKRFGTNIVLEGLDLEIPEGQSVVLVGPSGTGKSVLLKHIIGLIRPDSGQVIIDGVDLWSLSERDLNAFRRRFGMSFQEGALFDSMTVYENIAFPLRRQEKKSPDEVRARVAECLELVHLEGIEGKKPAELSGGMRRRVGFARAIALEPEILLFDEPTTGLDPIMTDVIDTTIVEMRERLRCTTVTITHDMESAAKIGDRIAMIYGGKIVADAPPPAFMKSDNPLVRQFVEGRAEGPMTQESWKRNAPEKGVPA